MRPRTILRPSDIERLAREYDNAPVCEAELVPMWQEYATFALRRQAELADEFTIQLVNVDAPYNHGSDLLADLVHDQYRVPAPVACPVHPCWDAMRFAASRTWHDIAGHGYGGVGFTLDEEIVTFKLQAEELRAHGLERLVPVVFSDTMLQLCSTVRNHAFAPQKVVCTDFARLLERCLS